MQRARLLREDEGVTPAAVIAGLGAWVPRRVVTNDMLAEELDTSDEWIRSRTGIVTRHVIEAGMATSDLAVEAGKRAISSACPLRPDALVLATVTPDHPCPATAPAVATRLGLDGIPAMDVAAVCSGFIYALAVGAGLIATEQATAVLVIGAEAYSTVLDPQDRTTRPIFGDGAGAVVLRAGHRSDPGALLGMDLGSDGSGADLIQIMAGGSRQRGTGRPPGPGDHYFRMRGREVFQQAVSHMADTSCRVLKKVGWQPEDVDWLVAHQANVRIVHAVCAQMGIPAARAVVNLDRVGNTSAASIPLALADAVARDQLRAGQRVLLAAFGGGLTWGAAALRWPQVHLTP
ncbi:beta-ketoacyl-ACP synthase III [Streptomyces shenzhenensis]|uniref:beta-ketoacyl-ACP synthase III n=1 Tax=Streptomyces shenzhenensis TaxID=943815 RepID=UPI003801AC34